MARAKLGHRMTRALLGGAVLIILGALIAGPAPVRADEAPAPVSRLTGSGSALTQLGQAIRALAIDSPSLVVVGLPSVEADPTGTRLSDASRETLREGIQKSVAALVPLAQRQVTEHLTPRQARLEARKADLALTYLQPSLHAGSIRLEVTFRKWSPSFWQRALAPVGIVTLDRTFEIEADSQIRALFPRAPALLEKRVSAPAPVASPVAVACGDFGGSVHEILVVGRSQITIGVFSGSKFVPRARRSWSELSPVSAFPLRAPLGSVAPSSGSALVGLSDRADLLGLNAELNVVGRAPRAFPLSAQSCADFTATGVSAEVTDCPDLKMARAKDRTVADAPGHDAVALASITESSGERVQFSARLPTGETKVQIEAESPIRATQRIVLEQSGDALALGDVDGDGTMDVVTSTAGAGKKDTLRIHSLVEGKAKPVANLSLAPVHALALCPFSGKNPLSLVVLAGQEIHTFY